MNAFLKERLLQGETRMRMLLRVSIPVEAGNAAAKAGTLGATVERILADLKPEAAYFFADDDGQRSGSIVFDKRYVANPGGSRTLVFGVQRQALFPASHESARSGRSHAWDSEGRQRIRRYEVAKGS